MTKYAAPQRAPRTRRSLSRRVQILAASLLLPISLLAIASTPAGAAPRHNPIFATIHFVNNAISTALAPIHSAIASLQTQQTNQATQISDLQTQQTAQAAQINNLQGTQSSIGKELTVYDANGTKLGLLINHYGYADIIYSPALGRFIEISDNEHGDSVGLKVAIIDSSGIGNILSSFSPLYYQSTDCSGTPFLSTLSLLDTSAYATFANDVMSFGDGKTYFIFHTSEPALTFTPGSQKSASTTCAPEPSPSSFNGPFSQLYPVSLPFSLPVAEPLQFKYQ